MEASTKTNQLFVYETLRKQILEGDMLPGEWIKESDLAEQLSVSRTPVREALRRLESELFVQMIPYRGARITKPDAGIVREEYIIRAALEGMAVELAVPHIDSTTLAKLEELADDMRALLDQHDIQAFLTVNRKFHMTVYEFAGYDRLINMINDSWDRDNLYRMWVLSRWPTLLNAEKVLHHEILDAIRNRDGASAGLIMRQSCIDVCDMIDTENDRS